MEKVEEKKGGVIKMLIKGTSLGIIFTLVSVIVFAFIIKLTGLSDGAVKAVNQFIKALAIFIGCFFSLKGRLGFLKGGLVGLLTFLITYLIFVIVIGGKILTVNFLIDLGCSVLVGIISGIIAVNVKKKEE